MGRGAEEDADSFDGISPISLSFAAFAARSGVEERQLGGELGKARQAPGRAIRWGESGIRGIETACPLTLAQWEFT